MVYFWRRFEEDWKLGKIFDVKNFVIDVILNIIYNDFLVECLYDGYRKFDVRKIRDIKCNICLSIDIGLYD